MATFPTTFASLTEMNRQMAEYNVRLSKIIAKGLEPAIQEQAKLVVKSMKSAIAHGEKLAQAETPQAAVELHTALAKELTDNFRVSAQKLLDIQRSMNEELKGLAREGVESFSPQAVQRLFEHM